jgi:putative methyltransferase (TIGR04325 family)
VELACPRPEALRLRLARLLAPASGGMVSYSGDYATWNEAVAAAGGWARDEILDKVEAAVAKVERGEAAAERDSSTFDEVQYSFPVMAALARAAAERGGSLSVLDFGGALGSSYRQFRAFCGASMPQVRWSVVEQEGFVQRGRARFQTEHLRFHSTPEEAAAESPPDVVLLSSVLQYLDDPYAMLERLGRAGSRHLVIDRTPLSSGAADRITVQRVPPRIYRASYACRVFSYARLREALAGWRFLADFPSDDGWASVDGHFFRYGGLLLERPR